MIIKNFYIRKYLEFKNKMFSFNINRNNLSEDEIWFVQHNSIFTCGIDKSNLFINKYNNNIPIYFNDRGGGIIYHGKGQQIIYTLINLKNYNLNIRNFIYLLENIILKVLKKFKINGHLINNMRGVYINNKKVCFIGLKVYKWIVYYGIALNVKLNLFPFSLIYPCGYKIKITQIFDFYNNILVEEVIFFLSKIIIKEFNKFKI